MSPGSRKRPWVGNSAQQFKRNKLLDCHSRPESLCPRITSTILCHELAFSRVPFNWPTSSKPPHRNSFAIPPFLRVPKPHVLEIVELQAPRFCSQLHTALSCLSEFRNKAPQL